MYNNNISTNKITAHFNPTTPYRTYPSQRRLATNSCLPKAEVFPGFLPVCMQGTWGWLSSQVSSFPTAWKSLMHMIIPHEIMSPSKCGGVINVSTITPKHYAGIHNACLQCVERQGALQTFESFFSLPKILFKIIFELTHISKTVQKKLFEIFSNKS